MKYVKTEMRCPNCGENDRLKWIPSSRCSDSEQRNPTRLPEQGSVRDIYDWLNKNGEVMENVVCVETYLNNNPEKLQDLRESRRSSSKSPLLSKRDDLQTATANFCI